MNILVAMSGGVDSSVAAKLLADAGNCCTGCTMKLYTNEDAGIPRLVTTAIWRRATLSASLCPTRRA